jgi:lipoate-protein ligase A
LLASVRGVKETESWRLLETGDSPGSFNLALDEALFLLAGEGRSRPTVRFYGWSPPALSVGYFQSWKKEIDEGACRTRGVDIVRRITGGRAVLHRDEVTYSVVCGKGDDFFGEGLWPAYRKIGLALVAGLQRLGVKADLARPVPGGGRAASRHPSCFSSSVGYEISSGGKKLVGSAQKRCSGAILQHGSILLAGHGEEFGALLNRSHRHPHAAMASLGDMVGALPARAAVVRALAEGFREVWGVDLAPGGVTEEERELAASLERSKYLSRDWSGPVRSGRFA